MKCKLVLILFCLGLSFACLPLSAAEEENNAATFPPTVGRQPFYVLTSGTYPPGYPLAIKETHGGNIGTIYDFQQKPCVYTLVNTSDKPVLVKAIQSTCACIRLDAPISKRTLAPKEELPVHFTIDATRVKEGKFDRTILVAIEDYPPVRLGVIGENQSVLEFSPAVCISLDNFTSCVPFTRTFTIKSKLDDSKLQLSQPEENQYFDVKFTKTAPQTYVLEVTSKKRLFPRGRFTEKIVIPATGIEHYGPAFVGLKGYVTPPSLSLNKSKIAIRPQDIPPAGTYKASFEVLATLSDKLHRMPKERRTDLVATLPVSVEEQKVQPLKTIETWTLFANELKLTDLPAEVTVEKVPRADGLTFNLSFPAEFLKTMKPFSFSVINGKKHDIGTIQCFKQEQE